MLRKNSYNRSRIWPLDQNETNSRDVGVKFKLSENKKNKKNEELFLNCTGFTQYCIEMMPVDWDNHTHLSTDFTSD